MPNAIQAGVYSAVGHYLKAVQAAGSDDTAKVRAQMGRLAINDMFTQNGTLRSDGRMVHDMYLFQVKTPSESTRAWDYYQHRATVSADDAFQPIAATRCAALKQTQSPAVNR